MDRYNYISPARVKVLLVPVNRSSGPQFSAHCDMLRDCKEVTLLDITPMTELKFFNPQTSPNGRIMMEYSSAVPDNESIFLHDFEPYRKTFIVLGLGQYNETISEGIETFNNELKKRFPSSIVHNTIIFNTPFNTIDQLNPKNDHSMKSTFFHNANLPNILETIMCEVSRNFLFHLDEYASSYANITLRSPVSISDSQLLTKTISKAQKRLSSGTSSVKVSFNSTSTLTTSELKSKAQVVHNGRHSKLRASFYLLAGKYVEALAHFTEAILYLRKTEDYMWLGSALEGIGISILLLNYTNMTYQLQSPVLATVLHLSKSKVRDMSENKISSDSLSRVTSNNSNSNSNNNVDNTNGNGKMLSPRNSIGGSGLSLNLPSLTSAPDLNSISIPELIKLINYKVTDYFQLSTNDFENVVPDLAYIESTLRHLQFILGVYRHGANINDQFFDSIVNNSPATIHATNPWFNKNNILNELDKIYSLQLVDLNLIDQCRIYCQLASVYNELKMYRKQAFALRTLLVAILPELNSPSANNSQIESSIAYISEVPNSGNSIKEILCELFQIYEINKQPEFSIVDSTNTSSNWNSLQLSLVKLSVKIFENLKDYNSLSGIYCLILTRYIHCLPIDDEIKLKDRITILTRQNVSIPYWDPFLVRDVKFVVNKNQQELTPFSEYSGTEIGDLVTPGPTPSATANNTPQITSPFIFDPFTKTHTISKDQLVIKDEVCHLRITLQNPYSFEIEINDIEVVSNLKVKTIKLGTRINNKTTTGAGTQSKLSLNNPKLRPPEKPSTTSVNEISLSTSLLIVPPKSWENFVVPFVPLESGDLLIKGFNITVGNCNCRFFPIIDEELASNSIKLKPSTQKFNTSPGDGFGDEDALASIINNLTNNRVSSRTTTKEIKLNVVEPQPSLTLVKLSVTNGWLMLLEGEKHQFSITLVNRSKQPINYLSFSFWDSTIQSLSKKLSSNSVTNALEVYELEWYLLKFKSFKILNKREINDKYKPIQGNKEIKIDYEITGKKGMVDSKMILEYGNKLSDLSKSFIKTIEIPLHISILPCIEMINFDIIPLFSSSLGGFLNADVEDSVNLTDLKQFIKNEIVHDNIRDYCLIIIDLRNSWTEDIQVQLSFKQTSQFKVNDTLKSKVTCRYLLPIKRISAQEIELKKRIPSLRNKQYVKDYSITESEDLEMRQHFWLRDSLLSKLTGSWKTKDRNGAIDLRNIRLSSTMMNCLLYPRVKITHEIIEEETGNVIQKTGSQVYLKSETFYCIKTVITNYDDNAISGILRHVPVQMNNREQLPIDKKIIINGLLHTKLALVEPQKSIENDMSFVMLENGDFEWGVLLETNGGNYIISREPVYIVVAEGSSEANV